MIRLYDSCTLLVDLPADALLDRDLRVGDRGAIVEIYNDGATCAVEFFEDDGSTIGLAWLSAEQIRPLPRHQPAAT